MRWLTAFVIVCLCSITIAWGWQTTRFAIARTAVIERRASGEGLLRWSGVPGLAVEALDLAARYPGNAQRPAATAARLASLLAAHPMSPQAWLSFASECFELRRSVWQVDAAVDMSRVTGPNEGSVMWRRGLFEAARWEDISANARREAAMDLAGAVEGGAVDNSGIGFARAILGKKSGASRAEIANALEVAGLPKEQLNVIGLRSASE